jgi:hypothetical protein
MVDISLAGLVGAVVGTAIAALVYGPVVALVEGRLQARDRSGSVVDGKPFEHALLLRVVLAADIIVFAGIGYWLGAMIGG